MSTLGDATDVNPANSKTQNAFFFPVHAMFRHDCPLAVKPASTPRRLVHTHTHTHTHAYTHTHTHTKALRDSLPIGMLLSAMSVLVVTQPSSEFPEGLMNYPVYVFYTSGCQNHKWHRPCDPNTSSNLLSTLSNRPTRTAQRSLRCRCACSECMLIMCNYSGLSLHVGWNIW